MAKLARVSFVLGMSLVSTAALADDDKAGRVPFASLSPVKQWMPVDGNGGDARIDWGYGNEAGMALMADELGDKLSEIGRASFVQTCFRGANEDSSSTMRWAICGTDAKALDLKKLQDEVNAEGVKGELRDEIINDSKEAKDKAMKIGAVIEAEAKTDAGIKQFLKLADDAKAEWSAFESKNKDAVARYRALKDAVRSGKTNNPGFKGCFDATQAPFTKIVKATAPKIPWDLGRDQLEGYMHYLEATTEGYIYTVAWAACAWSIHQSGEAPYAAAANRPGGELHAGWRTITLAKIFDPALKIKFNDRAIRLEEWTSPWHFSVEMKGINPIVAIQTPVMAVIGAIKPKDDTLVLTFKQDAVETCLQWDETNRIHSVNNGNVSYEKVCRKRGMVANQEPAMEVPAKYFKGNAGDTITVIDSFPVATWKNKKVLSILGVSL